MAPRHILSLLLWVLLPLSLVAQSSFEWIEERPQGVMPSIDEETWTTLLTSARECADGTASTRSKYGETIVLTLRPGQRLCILSCGEDVTYQVRQAPWRVAGDYPILQITTLRQPFTTSHLSVFSASADHQPGAWGRDLSISPERFLKKGVSLRDASVAAHIAVLRAMPVELHFDEGERASRVKVLATPSLRGWCSGELQSTLSSIISTEPVSFSMKKSGQWQ